MYLKTPQISLFNIHPGTNQVNKKPLSFPSEQYSSFRHDYANCHTESLFYIFCIILNCRATHLFDEISLSSTQFPTPRNFITILAIAIYGLLCHSLPRCTLPSILVSILQNFPEVFHFLPVISTERLLF